MGLITSMCTVVDGQGAALNEFLGARIVVASVGAFIDMYSVMALEIRLATETLCNAIAISLWLWIGRSTSTTEVGLRGDRIAYLWATFMPFALKGASGHVGSRGSPFDRGALLGGCLVHHVGG